MDRTSTRPRKAEAIYSATLGLLGDHGYDALTVEGIAAAAGVNKTTIYRTWATKDEVVADALLRAPELAFDMPDVGSLRGDLVELAHEIARLLSEPRARRVVTAVVAALPDRPATAAAAHSFFVDRLSREQVIFERALSRGELPPGSVPDPAMIVDLIAGNLWFRSLVRGGSIGDRYIEELVDTVVAGVQRTS